MLTGKGVGYGGSLARKEATGYGLVYFVLEMMKAVQMDPQGKKAIVSGSGNVAIYAAEKALQNGIQVIAMSDSKGYIVDELLDLNTVKKIKEQLRTSLSAYPPNGGAWRIS